MVRFLSNAVMMMTMMMMPLLIVVVRGDEKGEDVCSAVTGADDCSTCLDTSAVVAHEGIIYCARDPDATVSTSGLGISYMERSDDGASEVDTKWWKNIYTCEPDTKGNCHYDDDDDSSNNNENEEGEDVCYVSDNDDCSSCFDTAATVNHEGVLYCAKDPDATVSENGNGISYTEMDMEGDTNTKWWQNINLCQPNSNGFCHFDKDDINSNSLESNITDTIADNGKDSAATEASATTEVPVTVAATTTKAPVAATTTDAPVTVTTTEAPVAATATEAPVVATTTEAPVAVTTTEAPVAVTTTEAPVSATTTEAPVSAAKPLMKKSTTLIFHVTKAISAAAAVLFLA